MRMHSFFQCISWLLNFVKREQNVTLKTGKQSLKARRILVFTVPSQTLCNNEYHVSGCVRQLVRGKLEAMRVLNFKVR